MPHQMRLALEGLVPTPEVTETRDTRVVPFFTKRPTVVRLDPNGRSRWMQDPKHKGMVGKVFKYSTMGWLFFSDHAATRYHRNLQCPMPFDGIVLRWLMENEINWVVHYDRANKLMYRQQTTVIADAETRVFDGVLAYFLPEKEWEVWKNIDRWNQSGTWIYGQPGAMPRTKLIALSAPFIREPDITLVETAFFE